MGSVLRKCLGFGEEPAQTLSSATEPTKPVVPVPQTTTTTTTLSSATEPTEPVVPVPQTTTTTSSSVNELKFPMRERLDLNTKLGNISELKRELKLPKNTQLRSSITEYLRISTDTKTFFQSIDVCLKEAESNAMLLLNVVNLFFNREPISSVIEGLNKCKAHGETFPEIVNKFTSSCKDHFSHVKRLSDLEEKLGQNIRKVDTWKAVASIVCSLATFGLVISSFVLACMGTPVVPVNPLDQEHRPIDRLESEIKLLLDKRKSSLEVIRDNVGALEEQARKELTSVEALWKEFSGAIKVMDSIKTNVHKQVEVFVASVDEENIEVVMEEGNDKEVKGKMQTAMFEIKTETFCLYSCVVHLEGELYRCGLDLTAAVDVIQKAAEKLRP